MENMTIQSANIAANRWLYGKLRHIIFTLIVLIIFIFTDPLIYGLIDVVNSTIEWEIARVIFWGISVIGLLVFLSVATTWIFEMIGTDYAQSGFMEKYLLLSIILLFIFFTIVLGIKYGAFSAETDAFFRSLPKMNGILDALYIK